MGLKESKHVCQGFLILLHIVFGMVKLDMKLNIVLPLATFRYQLSAISKVMKAVMVRLINSTERRVCGEIEAVVKEVDGVHLG